MQPSQACLALVKASEGCVLTAYRGIAGDPSIGYGHTAGVHMGDICTQAQADQWLEEEVDIAAQQVESLVKVPVTQGQFDAITDFTFELGAGRLMDSTLLRLLNQGRYAQAGAQFQYWVMAAGETQPGMVTRRKADLALFNS